MTAPSANQNPGARPAPATDDAPESPRRVAVVIPAYNEAASIAATIRASRSIPAVDLVVVVDDGSTDKTQDLARGSGAVVVRHSVNRGKASAMETGAKVVAMRDPAVGKGRLILFIDADLGESAVECAPLVEPVASGRADCAIAALPPQPGAGGMGFVVRKAKRAILRATGFMAVQPLSGQRCLTREAFACALPFATGWGVEVAMTIDLLVRGFTVMEVPCDITHRVTGNSRADIMHRLAQYRDVTIAVLRRRLTGVHIPVRKRVKSAVEQEFGQPYKVV